MESSLVTLMTELAGPPHFISALRSLNHSLCLSRSPSRQESLTGTGDLHPHPRRLEFLPFHFLIVSGGGCDRERREAV